MATSKSKRLDKLRVTKILPNGLEFDDGDVQLVILCSRQYSDVDSYLCTDHLRVKDFKNLVFDLSDDSFYRQVEHHGIELIPVEGWSFRIPEHNSFDGYCSYSFLLAVLVYNKLVARYKIKDSWSRFS